MIWVLNDGPVDGTSFFKKMSYRCKDCNNDFIESQINHLVEDRFLCHPCLKKDNELKKKHNLPLNKMMLKGKS